MRNKAVIYGAALTLSEVFAAPFQQDAPIDTTVTMMANSPFYSEKQALQQHQLMEEKIAANQISDTDGFYLLFRYRESSLIPLWQARIDQTPQNDLFKLWFIDAVTQIGDPQNCRFIAPYLRSSNDMLRECAANAYGFLAGTDSIPLLKTALAAEQNEYVKASLTASIEAIQTGGYKNSVPYLPVYYEESPRKLRFFYNRLVSSGSEFQYEKTDSLSTVHYGGSTSLIFPTQQFIYKIKHGPSAGTFANKHGSIYHVGMDNGWLFEGLPVHAIANGIVKHISHDLSWGNVIAVESVLPKDTITVIYGHLSRFIPLGVGDTVHQGDRIGQIGNSVSYDNGGYWAHLHLGIAKGSFDRAKIVGYSADTTRFENPKAYIESQQKKEQYGEYSSTLHKD